MPVVDEALDRHQLDSRDAEPQQMIDDGLCRERAVGAAQVARNVGMARGEAFHVQLVDDRIAPRYLRPAVVAPGERRVDYLAARHSGDVAAPVEGQVLAWVTDPITEMRVAPFDLAAYRLRVGIEQQLVRVEPVPVVRRVGSADAVSVQQAGAREREVAVPNLVRVLAKRDRDRSAPPVALEYDELDLLGVLREEREVY